MSTVANSSHITAARRDLNEAIARARTAWAKEGQDDGGGLTPADDLISSGIALQEFARLSDGDRLLYPHGSPISGWRFAKWSWEALPPRAALVKGIALVVVGYERRVVEAASEAEEARKAARHAADTDLPF